MVEHMVQRTNGKIYLSHSGLDILERCPRCFWLTYRHGIYQPEGIVSRLANRFDVLVKRYFDTFRPSGELPPIIRGQVTGRLEHPFQELYTCDISDRYGFKGKLDECLIREDGTYTPVDHKTSSSDPRQNRTLIPAYQAQLDEYAYLLESSGKPTSGVGHLIYYYPDSWNHSQGGVALAVVVKTLETDPVSARGHIERGIEVLDGSIPQPSSECPFCSWRRAVDAVV